MTIPRPSKLWLGILAQLVALAATVGLLSADEARALTEAGGAAIGAAMILVPQLGTLAGLGHSIWVRRRGGEQAPPLPGGVELPPGEMFLQRGDARHPRFGPD
jgi:hypothetical protein